MSLQFPIEYERVKSRPTSNSYCKALSTLSVQLRTQKERFLQYTYDDVIDIYSLQAPVLEFATGDLINGSFCKLSEMHFTMLG